MSDPEKGSAPLEVGLNLPGGFGGSLKAGVAGLARVIAPERAIRADTIAALAASGARKIGNREELEPAEKLVLAEVLQPLVKRAARAARVVELSDEIAASPALLRGETQPPKKLTEPSEPFSDHWIRGAEVSSDDEHVQAMWARIRAGEMRRPGRFSLRTLAILPYLDQNIAEKFVILSRYVIEGWAVPDWQSFVTHYDQAGVPYSDFLEFEDAGLINFTQSKVMRSLPSPRYEVHIGSQLWRLSGNDSLLPVHALTRAGRDLAGISDLGDCTGVPGAVGEWLARLFPSVELETDGTFVDWPPE